MIISYFFAWVSFNSAIADVEWEADEGERGGEAKNTKTSMAGYEKEQEEEEKLCLKNAPQKEDKKWAEGEERGRRGMKKLVRQVSNSLFRLSLAQRKHKRVDRSMNFWWKLEPHSIPFPPNISARSALLRAKKSRHKRENHRQTRFESERRKNN
jgi:hypothetical protein